MPSTKFLIVVQVVVELGDQWALTKKEINGWPLYTAVAMEYYAT